ncbi:MAG: hypothetical protein DRP12_00935 [Candidatus Aenigmatarchaeota archaeon]|nr:MAG: hypothetical protein DRP12_00935 [Candidatus Aenigmarchaeota archaeon]
MRITTGIKGLDQLIQNGFPLHTVILLSGGPGTGKTLIGLNFLLEGAKKGEKCCFVSFNESKADLLRALKGIESLKEAERFLGKNLAIEHIALGEHITMKKFIEIVSRYPKIDRLVIDNVNKLLMFAESKQAYRIALAELVRYLRNFGCTLLICETEKDAIDTGNGEAFECDGVINLSFLEFEEKPKRILEIHKLRYTAFEPKVPNELVIDSKGIRLSGTRII